MTSVAQGAEIRVSVEAGEDLSGKQYYFVTWSGSTVVCCTAATDVPAGVLQEEVVEGRMAEIVVLGPTKLVADGTIAAGDLIGTSADGQADPKVPGTDTTEYVAGCAFEAATNAGDIFHAMVNCVTPFRAA
jgi:hypothetical protein